MISEIFYQAGVCCQKGAVALCCPLERAQAEALGHAF